MLRHALLGLLCFLIFWSVVSAEAEQIVIKVGLMNNQEKC